MIEYLNSIEYTHDISEIDNNFLYNADWKLNEPYMHPNAKAIICVYFAFTSLSTVGFGDYHPISNQERLFGAAMLLFGVAIFSYCMGKFVEIFNEIITFNASLDDGDNLHKFFGVIQHYNNDRPIKLDLKRQIESHFNYKWMNDKNAALVDDKDLVIYSQLPQET